MRSLWRRVRGASPLVKDGVVALVIAVAQALSLYNHPDSLPTRDGDALAYALAVVGALSFTFRRRYPVVVLAVVSVATTIYEIRDYVDNGLPIVITLTVYSLATNRPRRDVLLAMGAIAVVLVVLAVIEVGDFGPDSVVSNLLTFGIAAAFGDSLRNRRAYLQQLELRAADLERTQQSEAERAVAEERLRIARELHDVVAHAMSVVAVQSGVAAHVIDSKPDEAKRMLENVRTTSSGALDEMRRLLGVLRATGDDAALAPAPGLADVGALADGFREAGVPVELRVDGTARDVAPGLDLTAYRIVQEALTNVLKHAGPARATVTITYAPTIMELEVSDDGRGAAATELSGGHGLMGMHERVAVFGGTLVAGPRPGGGYRVLATLPYDAVAP